MKIEIHPKSVLVILFCIISTLLLFNIIGLISRFYFNHPTVYGFVPLFNFDTESNIPTFYSAVALLFSSFLLTVITVANKKRGVGYYYWLGLAIIFLFLSCDEIASIHESFMEPIRLTLNTSGIFYFAWVIPYGAALLLFVIAYLKFLTRLPKNIMILFIISGTTFVMGALGFELIGARHFDMYGRNNLTYSIITTCEEFLEMLGIALFIYTLLTYIASQFDLPSITVKEDV